MSWTPESGERRRHTRFPTEARARIKAGEKKALVRCLNLSTYGMCLDQVRLNLSLHQAIELRIILKLSNGITKIHWRRATVVWIMGGLTGVSMDSIPQHTPSVTYLPTG